MNGTVSKLAAQASGVLAGALVLAAMPAWAQTASERVVLAPHRAVYDLVLDSTKPSGNIETAKGRIAFEFTGDACEGYALSFRQVTQLGTEGGLPVTVTFVERLGHQTIVQAHRGDDETSLIAVLDGDVPVKAGERRAFVFSGDDCHLFNAAGNAYARRFVPE